VSAATITITNTSRTTKVGVSVRKVPRPAGVTFLVASEPATASAASSGTKRAASIAKPPMTSAKVMPNAPALPGPFGWTKPV
jgi:hypothetical protein